jgi:zinc protease
MAAPSVPELPSAVPPLSAERPVHWPKRTHARLSNGLEIILAESHRVPKFTGELVFRAGNAAVASVKPGLAGMTARVVRTGTQRRASRQIEDDLRGLGADLSSSAGADTTALSFAGLAEFSQPLLALVCELAREASFPEGEFERERRQKLEEIRNDRTTPSFLAAERLRNVLYGEHPYARYAPTEEQVKAYRRDDLVSVYREHYSPAHALLLLVGDFLPGAMLEQIEKVFGEWRGAAPGAKKFAEPPRLRGRRVHLVHVPGAVQAQILAGCPAITRKNPDWVKLVLANSIYGGAFNSRLVMNIREAKGYTYSPRSSLTSLRQYGHFSVFAAVRNEVVAATLTEIFYEMDRMRSLAIPENELADAQNYLSGLFSLGLGSQDGLLGQLSTVAIDELPEDYLETYRDKVRALKADDVLSAARTYLDSADLQVVVVGDRAQIETQAALFGEVEVYDAQGAKIPA